MQRTILIYEEAILSSLLTFVEINLKAS